MKNLVSHSSIKIKDKQNKKTFDILDIAGTLHPRKNKGKSVLEAREYMETHYKRV